MKKKPITSAVLMVLDESGEYRPAKPSEIVEAARSAVGYLYGRGTSFTSPDAARTYLSAKLSGLKAEVFAVLFLDTRHQLLSYREMFHGTIDGASVYPREVVRAALDENAAAVILAHNHPSGVAEPSQADMRITTRLKEALALIDVRVLDHIIVGSDLTSFAERGLL